MPPFNARNVAKFIAKSIVAMKTAQLTAETVADHTRFEEDDIVVDVGSKVVGWYIGEKFQPVTDKIIDTAADFVSDQNAKRKAKKDTKKEEK